MHEIHYIDSPLYAYYGHQNKITHHIKKHDLYAYNTIHMITNQSIIITVSHQVLLLLTTSQARAGRSYGLSGRLPHAAHSAVFSLRSYDTIFFYLAVQLLLSGVQCGHTSCNAVCRMAYNKQGHCKSHHKHYIPQHDCDESL